jgi:hypothetical protein
MRGARGRLKVSWTTRLRKAKPFWLSKYGRDEPLLVRGVANINASNNLG